MQKRIGPEVRTNADTDIQHRSMEVVPRWVLALCAVMLVLSFAIRQMGIDISSPINRIMSAHAVRIENEASESGKGQHHVIRTLQERLEELEKHSKPSKSIDEAAENNPIHSERKSLCLQ